MGVEITGYRRRTFNEILTDKIAKANELFGEDINTDENTALGKYIRINAYDQYQVEEIAEQIYYSIFPQTASGTSLDRLGWLVGITRNPALNSSYTVKIHGTPDTDIEAGFLVRTESGISFYTVSDATIGEDGNVDVVVQCTESGVIGNVNPSDICIIANPKAEIDSVVGIEKLSDGVEQESDGEFREKFNEVKDGLGSSNESSIRAALIKIPTVEDAIIDVDEDNHEFTCYVKGGESYHQEIAETIFDKKPLGITTNGNVEIPVSYGALNDYVVKFSHVTNKKIYINATITTNALFETTGNASIKANLESHINSIEVGHNLIFTSLYAPVYQVPGVVSVTLQISTDGSTWTSADIDPEDYEAFTLEALSINGTVV